MKSSSGSGRSGRTRKGCGVAATGRRKEIDDPVPTLDNGVVKHRSNDLKATTDAPIRPLIRPFQEFAARETSGGILLFSVP